MQVAVLGLGRMGMQIAKRLHKNKFDVFAWNRSEAPRKEFEDFGGKVFAGEKDLVAAMRDKERMFWVMLPQGVIEGFLFGENGLANLLKEGDILIEGGNSFYKESIRRAEICADKRIIFYDAGTSGGVWGEKTCGTW